MRRVLAGSRPDRRTTRTTRPGCRTRTRCAARPQVRAPAGTPSRTPGWSPSASWPPPSTTRWSLEDGRVESNGNFHGAPVGVRAGLPGDRRRRPRVDRRAPHRPAAGQEPLARPAAVPGRRPGRGLRPDDRAVHAGRAGQRDEAAGRARRRVDSIPSSAMQEDHVSMGWSAARKLRPPSTTSPGSSPSSCTRPPARWRSGPSEHKGEDRHRPPRRRRCWRRCARRACSGAGRDRFLSPDLEAAYAFVRAGELARAAESVTGPLA